jgi:hypothetical protein
MAHKSLMKWLKALAVAAFLAAGADVAHAQYQQCSEHGELVAHLSEKYHEKQFAFGTIGQIAVMEIFVGETGSWTVIVTDVTGRSCIVAAGENWENSVILPERLTSATPRRWRTHPDVAGYGVGVERRKAGFRGYEPI